MINKKAVSLVLVLAVLCLSLCGCETYNNFKAAFIDPPEVKTVVKVGIFEPLTGTDAAAAKDEVLGMEIAHDLYPELENVKIDLVYGDSQSDVETSKQAAQSLADQGVSLVLGSYGSVYSLAGGDVFKEIGIPAIAATNKNPILTKTNDYYFRVAAVEAYQGSSVAYFVHDYFKNESATVFMKENDDYAISMAELFESTLKELTGNEDCVVTIKYPEDTEDFTQYFNMVSLAKNHTIFFPGDAASGDQIIKAAYEQGFTDFAWIGTSRWDGIDSVSEGSTEYLSGVSYVMDYDEDELITPMTAVFKQAYAEKLQKEDVPSNAAALGFDAYLLALRAIAAAEDPLDRESIKNALYAIEDAEGATGYITINSIGDPYKEVVFERYINGEFSVVYTAPITGGEE